MKSILNAPYVVVLGSGKSINELSEKELGVINNAKVKIAINKFAGFYKLARIRPTHVFFYDDYSKSTILILKYIFLKLRKDGLKDLTFIVSKKYEGYFYINKFIYLNKKYYFLFMFNFKKIILKLGRLIVKPVNVSLFNIFKKMVGCDFQNLEFLRFSLLPKRSKIQFIEIQNWKTRGNFWAKRLNQKLFHYRGSLTTVLNYISILYPNSKILLIGVDFNSSGYFFDSELNKLNFNTSDWTTKISKENKKHFSIINFEGTKMDDEFPFIVNELKKTNNKMFSFSKKSYLVKKGFVEYIKI